jgi:hypothetical protein
VQADAAVGQIEAGGGLEAVKANAAKSGIAWVDGWNAVIRPGVATCTLRKRVNAADWEAVPAELRRWNKGGSRILKGLTIRREAAAALV